MVLSCFLAGEKVTDVKQAVVGVLIEVVAWNETVGLETADDGFVMVVSSLDEKYLDQHVN